MQPRRAAFFMLLPVLSTMVAGGSNPSSSSETAHPCFQKNCRVLEDRFSGTSVERQRIVDRQKRAMLLYLTQKNTCSSAWKGGKNMQTVKHASRPHSQGQALKKELRKNAGLYLLALIPFVYLILFKYWPMYGVQIAFRDYRVADGIWGSQWVGLKHFSRFLHTPKFLDIMKNTIIISLYGVLTFPLPILLAVMLNYLSFPRYRKCIQMVSYAPHFISTVVMVAILMQFLDKVTHPRGFV